jgi:molybdopterin-guanine dinucleotide biosynthesis protein A
MPTGVVLAGGLHHANENSPGALVDGRSPLQRVLDALASVVDDVVITTGPDQPLPFVRCDLPVVVCEDLLPHRGPLTGIFTGLQCARSEYALVVPCDTPFIQPGLLRDLLASRHGYDAAVPVLAGHLRPLPGVYRNTCVPALARALNGEDLSVTAFLRDLRACLLDEERVRHADPGLRSFVDTTRRRRDAAASCALTPS